MRNEVYEATAMTGHRLDQVLEERVGCWLVGWFFVYRPIGLRHTALDEMRIQPALMHLGVFVRGVLGP